MISHNQMYIKKGLRVLAGIFFTLFFGACYKTEPLTTAKADASLVPLQVLLDNSFAFHSFDTLLKKSGLYQRVTRGDSVFTLLIPDNAAFTTAGVSVDSLLRLPADSLQRFVAYHILAGSYTTAVIPQTIGNPDTSLSGQTVYFSKPLLSSFSRLAPPEIYNLGKTLHINGIGVKQVDMMASNGVVHVLAAPLQIPYSSVQACLSRPEYSLLTAALKKFNLYDQLATGGPYTIWAPNNAAFLKNKLDLARISSDTFDAVHYKPFLFTAGIARTRAFLSDFYDAPAMASNTRLDPTIFSPDGQVIFHNPYSYSDLPTMHVLDWIKPDPWSGYNQIGPNPRYTIINLPAANGVVHGLDDIMIYPDSVYTGH